MDISIIIPVWNEESKITTDLQNINNYFQESPYNVQVIVVNDGSTDQTSEVLKQFSTQSSQQLKLIDYPAHKGKGYAVRKGVKASQGEYVVIMDCGNTIPLKYIQIGIDFLNDNKIDIAFGSRYNPESSILMKPVWYRRVASSLFRKLTKSYLHLPRGLTDTQCGFKILNGTTARELFGLSKSDGFIFDLEIILLAGKRDYKLMEFPIEWKCDRDSRLSLPGIIFPVFKELQRLKKST